MKSRFSLTHRLEKMHKMVVLSPTQETDVSTIIAWESLEPNVVCWSFEKHLSICKDAGYWHFIIRRPSTLTPVGYAILKKNSPDNISVEFIRLVIADPYKSRGYGTWTFESIWDSVFTQFGYIRIWHDVFVENKVAIRLYDGLGYRRYMTTKDPSTGRELICYEMTKDEYLNRC